MRSSTKLGWVGRHNSFRIGPIHSGFNRIVARRGLGLPEGLEKGYSPGLKKKGGKKKALFLEGYLG